jgi:hypothetical protein
MKDELIATVDDIKEMDELFAEIDLKDYSKEIEEIDRI